MLKYDKHYFLGELEIFSKINKETHIDQIEIYRYGELIFKGIVLGYDENGEYAIQDKEGNIQYLAPSA